MTPPLTIQAIRYSLADRPAVGTEFALLRELRRLRTVAHRCTRCGVECPPLSPRCAECRAYVRQARRDQRAREVL